MDIAAWACGQHGCDEFTLSILPLLLRTYLRCIYLFFCLLGSRGTARFVSCRVVPFWQASHIHSFLVCLPDWLIGRSLLFSWGTEKAGVALWAGKNDTRSEIVFFSGGF